MLETKAAAHCGVMTVFGKNTENMLARVAAIAKDNDVNIEEDIAHTLGDRAIMFIKMVGTSSQLRTVGEQTVKVFEGQLTVDFQLTTDPPVPSTMADIPWRLRFLSYDARGVLDRITQVLAERRIEILSHQSERYSAARAGGAFGSTQTYVIRVPKDFNREEFNKTLQNLATGPDFFSATLEPL